MRLRLVILLSAVYWFLAIGCKSCFAYIQAQDTVKVSLVYLEYSELLAFDENRLPDAQILRGNVRFRHDSVIMYCDSAYFFEKENSLHAFGNVHMVQGDTIEGFGDALYYNGNTKMARLRSNVKLIHQNTILTTDSLNYDRKNNIAYYFSYGTIKDSVNVLTSRWGQYSPDNHQAIFRGNVKLVNSKFLLTADTLEYNTESYQSDLVGPTEILYEKETTIYSSNGWYNTQSELSMLLDRSQIIHADGTTLTGDTIYYDKKAGYGNSFGNIESCDSANHLTLYGHRGEVWDNGNRGYVTDSAMLLDWSDTTAFTYMHADTLWSENVPYQVYSILPRDSILVDSILMPQLPDTLWQDTTYHQLRAFYNVRIYSEDIQAVCDSVLYNGKDSIITLLGMPICWNEANQISADQIDIYLKNNTIDYLHGQGNTLAVRQEANDAFNQMIGKEMLAYVRDGDVYLVDVRGNAETVFYPREDDGTFVGVNRTQSSFVKLYITNQQIDHVVFTSATTGVMIPLSQAAETEKQLSGFFWADAERPRKPEDIFLQIERSIRPVAAAISASVATEDEQNESSGKLKKKQ